MRANESEAAGHVRPEPAAVRSTNRHADDQVAHQIELVIAADVCVISEEIRVEAEARFATDDTRAHAAGVHTESTAGVRGEPATEVDACPWIHPSVGVSHARCADERHRRRKYNRLDEAS